MSEYIGKINLIDMSDISQGPPGVGISRTSVVYCSYESGLIPPDLERIDLTTTSNQIIDFASTGASFRIINGILWAQVEGVDIQLSTTSDLITGINGWSPVFPGAQPGQYLWTKTIYYYTDDTQVVTYGVSRQGEDGIQGPQGPMGVSPSFYHLKCNQTEILMFEEDEGVVFSPEELTVSVYKDTPDGESSQQQIRNLTKENFKIEFFTSAGLQEVSGSYINLQNDQFEINVENLVNGLNLPEVTLMIDYIHSEGEQEYNLSAEVRVRYGMNKDMAQLSVNAGNIVASMQKSQLVFGGDGLTIKNGNFKIIDTENVDENGEPIRLLYSDNGNLTLVGHIEAESGHFKGDISSASGTIGGFEIKGNTLISTETNEGDRCITLDGKKGLIKAQNIELGTGAKISDYIMLGDNVKLSSNAVSGQPLEFLTIKKSTGDEEETVISFSDDGIIKVGSGKDNCIIINGNNSTIQTGNFQPGVGWQISPATSTFHNVAVRGSIQASVFEYGEIQTIGGMMIVRPSSKINNIIYISDDNATKIVVENASGFKKDEAEDEVGRYCIIQNLRQLYEILEVHVPSREASDQEHWVKLKGKISNEYIGSPLVLLGTNGEIGIGINSSTSEAVIAPTSLSVFEFNAGNQIESEVVVPELISHIILGKLPNQEKYGVAAGTYGLYAENVRLSGSLISNSNQVCAGISTKFPGTSPTSKNYEDYFNKTSGQILIWAGATGEKPSDIENSNFFIDELGNLYANSAYLNGAIISNATITASEIITAKITGNGKGPALLIQDTFKGIHFEGTKDEKSKKNFVIDYDDFIVDVDSINLNSCFKINNNNIIIDKPNIQDEESRVLINNSQIGFASIDNQNLRLNSYIEYIDNELKFCANNNNTFLTMKVTDSVPIIEAVALRTRFNHEVEYGEKGEVAYKPAKDADGNVIGYDLFIE